VAHGWQSLRDRTEVLCQATGVEIPQATRWISPADPLLAGSWPLPVSESA
jgi:hypothetical protein